LDKLQRVLVAAKSQRCRAGEQTASSLHRSLAASIDAMRVLARDNLTAVERPLHETTRPDVLKTPNIDRIARSLKNLAGNPEVATTLKKLRNRLPQTMEATGDARFTDEYDKTPWVGPLKERKR
jgi:hypothetical protein